MLLFALLIRMTNSFLLMDNPRLRQRTHSFISDNFINPILFWGTHILIKRVILPLPKALQRVNWSSHLLCFIAMLTENKQCGNLGVWCPVSQYTVHISGVIHKIPCGTLSLCEGQNTLFLYQWHSGVYSCTTLVLVQDAPVVLFHDLSPTEGAICRRTAFTHELLSSSIFGYHVYRSFIRVSPESQWEIWNFFNCTDTPNPRPKQAVLPFKWFERVHWFTT